MEYQQLITRRPPQTDMEDDSWLITFADMCVLLMCFFILLFSMSTPDKERFKSVVEGLREKGFYNNIIPTEDPFEKLKEEVKLSLGASGYDKQQVVVTDNAHDIEVELSSSAFFVVGTAKFSPEAGPLLESIAAQLIPIARKDVVIVVEGHTDDTPIDTPQFPSNWELSAARAASVVRFLIEQGFPPEKLRAVGRADTQPKAANRDSAGRPAPTAQEQNRRVVIKMMPGEDSYY